MTGRQFINRVHEIGRERNVPVRVDAKRGKGSHVTLYYGTRKTIVKDRRKELAPGPVCHDSSIGPQPERFAVKPQKT